MRQASDPPAAGLTSPDLVRLVAWAQRRAALLASLALGLALVVTGVFLFHQTHDTTLWRDEWDWAQNRRGDRPGTFISPHNGQFSLVPILIYRVLFATAGLTHYGAYRALVILAHLACVVLVYAYALPRIGRVKALVPAIMLLVLGPAAEDIIWPFQIGFLISLGTGVGAFLMFDRGGRREDLIAALLLGISLASSGLGAPIALALVIEILWTRRPLRGAWVYGVPVGLYAIWWLAYQTGAISHWGHDLTTTPKFVVEGIAGSLSSLAGLAGKAAIDGPADPLTWGIPLLIAFVVAAAWRLVRAGSLRPRVVALLAATLFFWTFTALSYGYSTGPGASRYIYPGALFVLLLGIELARGVRIQWRGATVIALAVLGLVASNVGAFRDAAADLRGEAALTKTALGTMEIARPLVRPDYIPPGLAGGAIVAGSYFATASALDGTPAANPTQITTYPPLARMAADQQLMAIHQVRLSPPSAAATGARPTVEGIIGGTASGTGSCVNFRPVTFEAAAPADYELLVRLPATGVVVRAEGGSAQVGVRRFGDGFQTIGKLAPGTSGVVQIGPDAAPQAWHLSVATSSRASVCGLG